MSAAVEARPAEASYAGAKTPLTHRLRIKLFRKKEHTSSTDAEASEADGEVVIDGVPAAALPRADDSDKPTTPRQQEKRRASDAGEYEAPGAGVNTGRRRSSAVASEASDSGDAGDGEAAAPGVTTEGDPTRIAFYHRDQPFFWLSNASEHPVYLDGQRYATAEHLFQSLKFLPHRPDLAKQVRKAATPSDATREARKQAAFVKKGWISQGQNVNAMRSVLLLKFSQHSQLHRQLLQTGDADLIQDSPTDAFWGSATGGTGGLAVGRNELGKALVRTRDTIRIQSGLGLGSGAKTV